jgi:geranylgeranylglycerol-phosphate geranylgeranyltransferase
MSLRGYIAITRPVNSVVAGLAAVLGYLIASQTLPLSSFILIPIVAFVTAGGNAINDFFDADIDRVNRPKRPIPSGAVSRGTARGFAIALFFAGILLCLVTTTLCVVIVVINSLLLIAYAARLKSLPILGNITVSYLSASIFLFGGSFGGWNGLVANLPLAAITFLAMIARELLKDAEDVEGDSAGGARTLPMQIGIKNTGRVAFTFAVLAIFASLIPGLWWGSWYLAGIGIVDLVILAAAARALPCYTPACVHASEATTLLKAGMFASLVVFLISALAL